MRLPCTSMRVTVFADLAVLQPRADCDVPFFLLRDCPEQGEVWVSFARCAAAVPSADGLGAVGLKHSGFFVRSDVNSMG